MRRKAVVSRFVGGKRGIFLRRREGSRIVRRLDVRRTRKIRCLGILKGVGGVEE